MHYNPQSKTNGSDNEEDQQDLRNTTKLNSIANTYSQGSIENQHGATGQNKNGNFHMSIGTNGTNATFTQKGDNNVHNRGVSGVESTNAEIMNI